jgi:hypothetical protein
VEATALSPWNLSTDLTELFHATLNVPPSPLIPILNKKRAAEPANDMITGNNDKKGKQVTDDNVMHIPCNFLYRAKTGRKKEYPTFDDYSTWNVNQIRKECTARKLNMKFTLKREERVKCLVASVEMKIKLALYVTNTGGQPSPPSGSIRSKHCMIRLINILFDDALKVDFMKLGKLFHAIRLCFVGASTN